MTYLHRRLNNADSLIGRRKGVKGNSFSRAYNENSNVFKSDTEMEAELVNKFSKYIKTIANRVVEVEFVWFQVNPYQTYRLRINEKQFNEAQKHIHSKKLSDLNFEQFTELITPIFANDVTEINMVVLQSSYDCLFDQTSVGHEQFDSLLTLLHGVNAHKRHLLHENLRHIFGSHSHHISFERFYDLVKCGYLRELLMS